MALGSSLLLELILVIGLIGLIGNKLLDLGMAFFTDNGKIGLANLGVGGLGTKAGL